MVSDPENLPQVGVQLAPRPNNVSVISSFAKTAYNSVPRLGPSAIRPEQADRSAIPIGKA